MSPKIQKLLLPCLLLFGIVMCGWMEWSARSTNGAFGFPLDDPWIHLQFSRNLHDYGAFSYYKNEMVTSGSTSPLYTILLSVGFFISRNEFLVSYSIGIAALAVAGFIMFRLSMDMFGNSLLFAGAATLLLLLEPRLEWAALSGMETTVFIFLLLASFYCYRDRRSFLFGLTAGLSLWARPDAVLFYVILFLDTVYAHTIVRLEPDKKKKTKSAAAPPSGWVKLPLLMVGGFGLVYVLFNWLLSGSVFPNTFAAKIKYYAGATTDFPAQVFHYLADGHLIVMAFFVAAGIVSVCFQVLRRKPAPALIPFLWIAGVFLVYWTKLPLVYQQGRYLMPILPFVILLGMSGLQAALATGKRIIPILRNHIANNTIASIILGIATIQFAVAAWDMRSTYAQSCKYIDDRQVTTARWIHDNLPESSIIATHDIGSLAFYSGRRIVDMVGLVSPDLIDNVGQLDKLRQFMINKHVTHLAVLRDWFEVVNQNSLFHTDEQTPEIMEVFPFDTVYTYIMDRNVAYMMNEGEYRLATGDFKQAEQLLERAVQLDPHSSKIRFLLGNLMLAEGKLDRAESELKISSQLHPFYWDAETGLAQLLANRNQPFDAIAKLESVVQQNPSYGPAYGELAQLYSSLQLDSLKMMQYARRYQELSKPAAK